MSESAVPAVIIARDFDCSVDVAWNAWTRSEDIAQWFGPQGVDSEVVENDFRVGGSYAIQMQGPDSDHHVSGTYRVIETGRRLAYTWKWKTIDTVSLVTIDFTAVGDRTRIRITHANLPTEESRQQHTQGWSSSLECLTEFVGNA